MAGLQGAAGQDSCPLFDRWGNPGPLMVEPGYGGARTGAQALAPCAMLFLLKYSVALSSASCLCIVYAAGFSWRLGEILRGYHPLFSGLLMGQGQTWHAS